MRRWSKIKKDVVRLICPQVRKRIDFHVTAYREAHDDRGEAWITIDGKKVFGCGYYKHVWGDAEEWGRRVHEHFRTFEEMLKAPKWEKDALRKEVEQALLKREIHDTAAFVLALKAYPSIPIRNALQSRNPFIRALALIDRRVGERTLESIRIKPSDHSLVKLFYAVRTSSLNQ